MSARKPREIRSTTLSMTIGDDGQGYRRHELHAEACVEAINCAYGAFIIVGNNSIPGLPPLVLSIRMR